MTNWYYYDKNGQKQGLLTTEALQELVTQGVVIPTTKLVTEAGQEGLAGQVDQLVFPTAPQPSPFSSMPPHGYAPAPPTSNQQKHCTNCGNIVADNAVVCMACGVRPQGHRKFCDCCGAGLNPVQVVCIKCGSSISGSGAFASSTQPSAGMNPTETHYADLRHLGIGYFDVILRKYAQFSGRARRREFLPFALISCAIYILMSVILAITLGNSTVPTVADIVLFTMLGWIIIFPLAIGLPSIALTVRRLHDRGLSGWFWFINCIPSIGPIAVFVLCCLDSQQGDNAYGPYPK